MAKLIGVPAFAAHSVWPHVLPYVERYLRKAKEHRWSAADLLANIEDSSQQLWLLPNAETGKLETVIMTELINYPQCRECNVFMVSGKMTTREGWREIVEEMVDWAASKGCHYVSSMARRGSEQAMGWEARQTYIVRGI